MKHFSWTFLTLVLVALVLGGAATLQAGVVSVDVVPPTAGGLIGIDNNIIVIYKDFNPTVGLGPVDVNVTVDAAGDYTIREASHHFPTPGFVHNYSGYTWTDFHNQLTPQAGFKFVPGFVQSDVFTIISGTSTPWNIDLEGGVLPVGSDFHQVFAVHADAPGTFTIRETATVPEPSTLLLVAACAGGLMVGAWRRKRAVSPTVDP